LSCPLREAFAAVSMLRESSRPGKLAGSRAFGQPVKAWRWIRSSARDAID
jgi:hypothetical protein